MDTQTPNKKQYDLEERTFLFAQNVRNFIQKIPHSSVSQSDVSQLLRSSGSVGANYIEANESLSKKDFFMLIPMIPPNLESTRQALIQEAIELRKIFGAILTKAT